jgi:hypothetical protein
VGVDVSTCSERDTNSIANALNVSSARNKWDTERRQNYIHGPRCRSELERSLIVEQSPNTKSRWAAMARDGKKVMQFLVEGRYVANVIDGKLTPYSELK